MKTAVVTGGTKGIGRAVAELLLQRGWHVIANYAHDEAAAREMRERQQTLWPESRLDVLQADQSRREGTYSLADYVRRHTTRVDCIVCNAGLTVRKPFEETADADWDAMMETAVNSHFILLRELFPLIPPGSRILFTGSLMALHPHATVLGYGVSKAAVHALALNLQKQFEGTGTTVNTIAPGFVETEWQKNKPEAIRQNIYAKTAIKRFATTEEVADAFRFCLDNDFVNGSVIEVSGGYSFK
ncbi:MAG: SDR family oxidoreductase [Clostridium sp.]|nr:SDR family oxidoreductase [Clostridium sp.]